DGVSVAVRANADGATPPTSEVIPGSMLRYPTDHLHTGPIGVERIIPNSPTVYAGDQITFLGAEFSGSGSGWGGVGTTTVGGLAQQIGCVWLKNGTNLFQNMVYQTNEYWVTPPITLADDGA